MNKFSNKRFLYSALLVLIAANGFIWQAILFGSGTENLGLYFLDVGQGDSELINFPGDVQVLIDGGPNTKVLEGLARALPAQDRYIDLVVVSHPQLDHFGGLIDVLESYKVGAVIENGRKGTTAAYADFEKTLQENGVRRIILTEGDKIKYEDATLSVLSPNRKNLASKELNDSVLVMMLEKSGLRALYTGDIGKDIEDELLKKYDLSAQVLKVGHHGSRFSSSPEFLKAVNPVISVIEVGKNTYGHPTPAALGRLADVGTQIFRTDRDRTILVDFDGDKLRVYLKKLW
ncbi:MAG: hypothetical protein A2214_00940 [Candidatus Harrisonbacteria bacterium RIFOXYA1_FULL_48_8]|uniref:Metallo-beta-lactamase domain-containing protein n=2 Tax=Candidatus Harrisoniibacteriota TaxID=1817905 RepID=A0A1G1ZUN4_9BACT|nr:MAG: hypothetical protein A3E64_02555 [Candidatus Harrisonbacteria bacterium RIFCSPHIGHO2_12_FULL_48_16]OGY68413.1 MAG: hypothetical protein A2214_00940 [Candidatus Harrisonbacteria bacterium RIFOXYA1_FULL_48_8]